MQPPRGRNPTVVRDFSIGYAPTRGLPALFVPPVVGIVRLPGRVAPDDARRGVAGGGAAVVARRAEGAQIAQLVPAARGPRHDVIRMRRALPAPAGLTAVAV